MRNLDRIDTVLNRLSVVWKRVPDLRLGQLLLNVASDPVLYYLEDEELINKIEQLYEDCVSTENSDA